MSVTVCGLVLFHGIQRDKRPGLLVVVHGIVVVHPSIGGQ